MTVWILAALVLRACLIGNHPFYEARDVVADDRVTGTYADPAASDITVTVTRTTKRGRYRAVLQENGNRSLYAITLFRVGARTFADLAAEPVPTVQPPDSRTAPATAVLRTATAMNQHVALRVEPRSDGLTVWLPLPDTLNALWQQEPALRRSEGRDTVAVVTEPTSTLRRLLARHGQDNAVFSEEYWLAKTRR